MSRQHKGIRSLLRHHNAWIMIFVMGVVGFDPCVSQAKADDDQTQIILLNDSASALEDSNPKLSKELTEFADEREKEWEYKNANKDAPLIPVTAKDIPRLQGEIKLLRAAILEIKLVYPLIAQSLKKMADGISKAIEIKK